MASEGLDVYTQHQISMTAFVDSKPQASQIRARHGPAVATTINRPQESKSPNVHNRQKRRTGFYLTSETPMLSSVSKDSSLSAVMRVKCVRMFVHSPIDAYIRWEQHNLSTRLVNRNPVDSSCVDW